MTEEQALAFLRDHQPLPKDEDLSEEVIDTYDEVRRHFLVHKNADCIPLFLNSFGRGSGYGNYQLVENVIRDFPPDLVIPHLITALQNDKGSVQYWSSQIAADFPSPALVPYLAELLKRSDGDVRWAAATALEEIDDPQVRQILLLAMEKETDPELYMQLREATS